MRPVPYVGKELDDGLTAQGQQGKWGNRIRVNCYFDPQDMKKLQEIAEQESATLAAVIRVIIKKGLDR